MEKESSPLRNIADTARWVAYFRAKETERTDALFRDPYAARLAGDHGFDIAKVLTDGDKHEWAWSVRTFLFDKFIAQEIREGADLILCLAAGLDARPYRMSVTADLQWVEVDFPEVLAYKQELLACDTSICQLRRVSLDLLDVPGRQKLLSQLNNCSEKIVVVTEGLLPYLETPQVASLAQDLSTFSNIQSWVIDLISPGLLNLIRAGMGRELAQSGAEFKFGPSDGVGFFVPYGWTATAVEGLLKNAATLHRAPQELLSLLPEPHGSYRRYPWTGVCLLKRSKS